MLFKENSFKRCIRFHSSCQGSVLQVQEGMWWCMLTPAVDDMSSPCRREHPPRGRCAVLTVICLQDRRAVRLRCEPEPELSGEEHPAAGQQQHEGPAHLRQRHTDGTRGVLEQHTAVPSSPAHILQMICGRTSSHRLSQYFIV